MKTSPTTRLFIFGLAVGLFLVALGWLILWARPYTYQGSLIDPPSPVPDFTLMTADGSIFRLSDHQGKLVVLFFGYTHCPDVCPSTLAGFSKISQDLGNRSDQVVFAFVTVDPERDTPELLKAHLENFKVPILGLSGEQEALQAVYQTFGVFSEKREVGSASGYLVDHTAVTYVIDKSGRLRLTYPFGFERDKIVSDMSNLLKEEIEP